MFFVSLLLLLLFHFNSGGIFHHYSRRLEDAIHFINTVQQPRNCVGLEYAVVGIGVGGGFAAQFQLAASEWMRAFAALNFSKPVLIEGRIYGYSDGPECAYVNKDWTCYFHPMSSCQDVLLKTGHRIDYPQFGLPDEQAIPPAFVKYGLPFWWGVVQHKMFRVQTFVERYILEESKFMNFGNGFPFGLPVAGMHVRHGDKHTDGFKWHSLAEELATIRKSSDCSVQNVYGDCFYRLNHTSHAISMIVNKAINKHTIIIRKESIDKFNMSNYLENLELGIDPKNLINRNILHKHNVNDIVSIMQNDSSSVHDLNRLEIISQYDQHASNNGHNNNNNNNYIMHEYFNDSLYIPLTIFVASDDVSVLKSAHKLGFMVDTDGVSQNTANDGMLKTLLSHPEFGYNATLEIVTDIYFLSQCSTLLGISASQVFRMAVALSNVTGTLKYAAAMDGDQIWKVKQMSAKYHIPFPENFIIN